eukprot:1184346-Prorocentrum_minimum.AAC.4
MRITEVCGYNLRHVHRGFIGSKILHAKRDGLGITDGGVIGGTHLAQRGWRRQSIIRGVDLTREERNGSSGGHIQSSPACN